jgi:hypothetical protein
MHQDIARAVVINKQDGNHGIKPAKACRNEFRRSQAQAIGPQRDSTASKIQQYQSDPAAIERADTLNDTRHPHNPIPMIKRVEHDRSRPKLHKQDQANNQIRSVSQASATISIPLQQGHHEDVKPRQMIRREPVNPAQPARDQQGSGIEQFRRTGTSRQMLAKAKVMERANSTRSTTGHAQVQISDSSCIPPPTVHRDQKSGRRTTAGPNEMAILSQGKSTTPRAPIQYGQNRAVPTMKSIRNRKDSGIEQTGPSPVHAQGAKTQSESKPSLFRMPVFKAVDGRFYYYATRDGDAYFMDEIPGNPTYSQRPMRSNTGRLYEPDHYIYLSKAPPVQSQPTSSQQPSQYTLVSRTPDAYNTGKVPQQKIQNTQTLPRKTQAPRHQIQPTIPVYPAQAPRHQIQQTQPLPRQAQAPRQQIQPTKPLPRQIQHTKHIPRQTQPPQDQIQQTRPFPRQTQVPRATCAYPQAQNNVDFTRGQPIHPTPTTSYSQTKEYIESEISFSKLSSMV